MTKQAWANRIVGYGEEAPADLLANPANFRLHPKPQQDALAGVLAEVGLIQNVIVNRRTQHVVDGHLRISLAMRDDQPTVPITYVDLSEDEERLILATLDPIAAMAATDRDQLAALLEDVSTGEAAVQAMLADMAAREGITPPFDAAAEWQGMPEYEQDELRPIKQVVVSFATQDAIEEFARLIGAPIASKGKTSIWFPMRERRDFSGLVYAADGDVDAA